MRYFEAFGRRDFATPWFFIHRGVLPPGAGIGHHRHQHFEEMYTIFDGSAQFTRNAKTATLNGPVMVPCLAGDSHGIYNHTDREVQFMNLGVAPASREYDATNFGEDLVGVPLAAAEEVGPVWIDHAALKPASKVHQGAGELLFRRLWSPESFATNWGFIDHIVIPPGASIGYHRHDTIEECYMILSGSGRMKVDGEVVVVSSGDFIPNRLHGCHGIYNHTREPLELLNMAVCLEKGKFDATDLGDDLTADKVTG